MPAEVSEDVPVPTEAGDYPDGGGQEGEEVENMVATNHTGNADTSAHQVMCR